MLDNNSFYDGMAEETQYFLDKAQLYVQLAIKNGDAAIQEKPREIIIKLRKPSKEKT